MKQDIKECHSLLSMIHVYKFDCSTIDNIIVTIPRVLSIIHNTKKLYSVINHPNRLLNPNIKYYT